MESRILTLHPEGKEGVNISQEKYTVIRKAILEALEEYEQVAFKDLLQIVKGELAQSFKGSVPWYVTTVKLDLEARKEIVCKRGRGPQVVSLA